MNKLTKRILIVLGVVLVIFVIVIPIGAMAITSTDALTAFATTIQGILDAQLQANQSILEAFELVLEATYT